MERRLRGLGGQRGASADEIGRRIASWPAVPSHGPRKTQCGRALQGDSKKSPADEKKRSLYDQYGHAEKSSSQGNFNWNDFSHFGRYTDIRDLVILSISICSMAVAGNSARRPADDVDITRRGVLGTRKHHVPKFERCDACKGTGAKEGKVVTCSQCGGTGQTRRAQTRGFAQFVSVGPCPSCRGTGRDPGSSCPECDGQGINQRTSQIERDIPKGVDTGNRLRIAGAGEMGAPGQQPGDLYVVINVQDHPVPATAPSDDGCRDDLPTPRWAGRSTSIRWTVSKVKFLRNAA